MDPGYLLNGLLLVLSPENLLFAVIGCVVGTLVGVLPGLGSASAMAILIPLTFDLPPLGAIVMLAAIFYGSYYGGTITTVLMNVPGEASSAVIAEDGHALARKGKAGVALSMAAIGSFIGGIVGIAGLVFAAPKLAELTLLIGPPEFFALVLLGLALIVGLTGRSIAGGLAMAAFGALLAIVGIDPGTGAPRFTFGQDELLNGLEFVPVAMGLFGLSEILVNIEGKRETLLDAPLSTLVPNRSEWRQSGGPMARASILGGLLGLIPGTTQSLASALSYSSEVKLSKSPERFGKGALEGVVGPETANNAHATSSLIPLFTLGIPGSASLAILLGAFTIHGLTPGPRLFLDTPEFAWAVIASLVVGNVVLLILNLPLIRIWVLLLKVPYAYLYAIIILFILVGAYAARSSMFDILVVIVFGLVGYFLRKAGLPLMPILLALILTPLMEQNMELSLGLSGGDFAIFLRSPVAIAFLAMAALALCAPAVPGLGRLIKGSQNGTPPAAPTTSRDKADSDGHMSAKP